MILASCSPRRKELLKRCGVEFSVFVPQVDEVQPGCGISVKELPLHNAGLKAMAATEVFPQELVLGADTVVVCDDIMFGKPQSEADSFRMLTELSGKTHQVITGVALISKARQIREMWSEVTQVRFKNLSPADIENYISCVYTLDKAGAYAIQEHPDLIIDGYDGELENVIGLPLKHLQTLLHKYL